LVLVKKKFRNPSSQNFLSFKKVPEPIEVARWHSNADVAHADCA